MIIVDTALRKKQEEGDPIRVGMVGAGAMGMAIARQILTSVPGMTLVAIANRHVAKAERAYRSGGAPIVSRVGTTSQLENAIARNSFAVTDDPEIPCVAKGIDVILRRCRSAGRPTQ